MQLIWLTAQLSSLHISLQTNPTQSKLSWPQKLARSNAPLTSPHVKLLLAYMPEMAFVITNVHIFEYKDFMYNEK